MTELSEHVLVDRPELTVSVVARRRLVVVRRAHGLFVSGHVTPERVNVRRKSETCTIEIDHGALISDTYRS